MTTGLFIASQLVLSLTFCAGLVGNLLVLYVMFTFLRRKSKDTGITMRCITHLAIADLVTCVTLPVLAAALSHVSHGATGHFSPIGCRSYLFLTTMPQFLKAFILTVLAVICYALHEGSAFGITDTIVTAMISGSWILALLISVPVATYASVSRRQSCNVFWPENVSASDAFVLIYAFCVFMLPLAVVFAIARKRKQAPFAVVGEDVSMVRTSIHIVFVLVSVHLILLFPFLVGQLVLNYVRTAPGYLPVWKITFSLLSGWIWNSAVALFPLLYYFLSDDMNEGIRSTLHNIGRLRIRYTSITSKPVLKLSQNV